MAESQTSNFNPDVATSTFSATASISREFKDELSSPKDEQDDFTSKINEWNQMTEMSIRRLDKTETEQTDFESKINEWNQMTEMSIRQLDIRQETDEMDVKGRIDKFNEMTEMSIRRLRDQIETDEESRLSSNKHLSTNLNGNKDENDSKNENGNEKKDDHQVESIIAETALEVAYVNGPSRTKIQDEIPDIESLSTFDSDRNGSDSKNKNNDNPSIPLLPDNKQTQDSKSDIGNNTTLQESGVEVQDRDFQVLAKDPSERKRIIDKKGSKKKIFIIVILIVILSAGSLLITSIVNQKSNYQPMTSFPLPDPLREPTVSPSMSYFPSVSPSLIPSGFPSLSPHPSVSPSMSSHPSVSLIPSGFPSVSSHPSVSSDPSVSLSTSPMNLSIGVPSYCSPVSTVCRPTINRPIIGSQTINRPIIGSPAMHRPVSHPKRPRDQSILPPLKVLSNYELKPPFVSPKLASNPTIVNISNATSNNSFSTLSIPNLDYVSEPRYRSHKVPGNIQSLDF